MILRKLSLPALLLATSLASAGATQASTIAIDGSGDPSFGSFDPGNDVFSIDAGFFGVTAPLKFQNGIFGNPALDSARIDGEPDDSGAIDADVNVVVIQNFDNDDANGVPPSTWNASWNARTALRAIANNTTGDRAGFFLYWNEGLGVNRLFATDNLNDGEAAFRRIFTIQSDVLTGSPGDFDLNLADGAAQVALFPEANANLFSLQDYEVENFVFADQVAAVPLPAGLPLFASALALGWCARRRKRQA